MFLSVVPETVVAISSYFVNKNLLWKLQIITFDRLSLIKIVKNQIPTLLINIHSLRMKKKLTNMKTLRKFRQTYKYICMSEKKLRLNFHKTYCTNSSNHQNHIFPYIRSAYLVHSVPVQFYVKSILQWRNLLVYNMICISDFLPSLCQSISMSTVWKF